MNETSSAPAGQHRQRSEPQAGILNRPPEHLILGSFNFNREQAARDTLAALQELVRKELHSDLDAPNPPDQKDRPSDETGELGYSDNFDRGHLTITLGLAAGAFDALETPAGQRPQDLIPIPWASLGDDPAQPISGDLVLQVCSDDVYVAEHAIRRVEEELGDRLATQWALVGSQRYTSRPGRTSRREGRALIGFLDGTSNLNPRNDPDDRRLVFVDPDHVEYPPNPPTQPGGGGAYPGTGPTFPELRAVPTVEADWTRNGTYMVVRASTFDTTAWDDETQNAQEQAVGRFKFSGTSLDLSDDPTRAEEPPAFAADQTRLEVPLDAHTRKSNPRRAPEDEERRIFRRGYPLIHGSIEALRRGLIFVAFARTTSTQFEFIMRAWLRNRDFPSPGSGDDHLLFHTLHEQVVGGGYYFVPARHPRRPWDWVLPPLPAV